MKDCALTVEQAIEGYADFLAHERHSSRATQASYKAGTRRFRRFLLRQYGRELMLCEVTEEDIRGYLYSLSRQGLRPRTLRGAMYPIRGLCALGVERGWRGDNPALAVNFAPETGQPWRSPRSGR